MNNLLNFSNFELDQEQIKKTTGGGNINLNGFSEEIRHYYSYFSCFNTQSTSPKVEAPVVTTSQNRPEPVQQIAEPQTNNSLGNIFWFGK